MLGLARFLSSLQPPEEQPIEPELKADKQDKDRAIREEQDLQAGAVLEATVAAGEGSNKPQQGDLVYVHYSVANEDGDVLHTTWAEDGGSGQTLAFMLGKGRRAPRAWELSLMGMTRNTRKRLKVQPSYGYQHPSCAMTPPPGVPAGQVLTFELQLLNWYPGAEVRVVGDGDDVFKRVLVDSDRWETARAPNEVTLSMELRTPAYDGQQCSGFCYHAVSADAPLAVQLGQGRLPRGIEDALLHMSKGETAVFVLPADQMAAADAGASSSSSNGSSSSRAGLIPPPPAKAVQVEATLQLHDLIQVRDMTGDGGVIKKRLREGAGEFPVDCPLHDTTVRLHFRARQLPAGGAPPGEWLYDSRAGNAAAGASSSSSGSLVDDPAAGSGGDGSAAAAAAAAAAAGALEADTGCGELPEGLEMALKLMVPGEVASAVCQPKYAYQGRSDAPPGLSADQPVEFEVLLLSFEREGYWQNLDWEQRWALAQRLKDKGNALFKAKKYGYAGNRYSHLLRLIESTRDFEEQAQVDAADALKASLLRNLALVAFQQGEFAAAVSWCDKALEMEPGSGTVLFRKGKALSMKGDYEEADAHLAAAAEADASLAADVEAARASNRARAKAADAKQRSQFKNFFSKA